MATSATKRISERRSEHLLNDLLVSQGWGLRRPPYGDLVFQNEYPDLSDALAKASKSGTGFGIPEAIILDRETTAPSL